MRIFNFHAFHSSEWNIVAVILCRSLSRYTRRPQGENTRNQIFYLFLLENTFSQTRALSRFNLWQITDKTLSTYPLTSFDLIGCFYSFRRHIKTLLFSHRRTQKLENQEECIRRIFLLPSPSAAKAFCVTYGCMELRKPTRLRVPFDVYRKTAIAYSYRDTKGHFQRHSMKYNENCKVAIAISLAKSSPLFHFHTVANTLSIDGV